MAGERYVEVTSQQVACILGPAGFVKKNEAGCLEEVYFRDINNVFAIKVYTSVHLNTGVSRAVGDDAIRLVLWDKIANMPVKKAEKRVFRTKNAMENMKERARDLWRFVQNSKRCDCGGLLVERTSKTGKKFCGCSRFGAKDEKFHCKKTVWSN